MSFLSTNKSRIEGVGPPDARIALVGEAPGAQEEREGKPFVGPSGSVLDACLHSAGLTRHEVYITNVVKVRPGPHQKPNDISPYFTGKTLTEKGVQCRKELIEELNNLDINVVVSVGSTATYTLLNKLELSKIRGYIFPCPELKCGKVIPTIHPANTIYSGRSNYIHRYYITSDLKKASRHSDYSGLSEPDERLVTDMTYAEALEWLDFFYLQKEVAFDIEVINYEMSMISLCTSTDLSVSIPLYGHWSETQEIEIWKRLARVLENPDSVKILQNAIFDVWFLAYRCNIIVKGEIRDTMIAHHIMFPDMLKSLNFLGSIYSDRPYWKDMADFKNIKKES